MKALGTSAIGWASRKSGLLARIGSYSVSFVTIAQNCSWDDCGAENCTRAALGVVHFHRRGMRAMN